MQQNDSLPLAQGFLGRVGNGAEPTETFNSPDRDYYIQSKGHCAEALFVALADQGFFPKPFNRRSRSVSIFTGGLIDAVRIEILLYIHIDCGIGDLTLTYSCHAG
jgi:hypothetical protein